METDHIQLALAHWARLNQLRIGSDTVVIDGQTLSIADVIAACNYNVSSSLTKDEGVIHAVAESVNSLQAQLDAGETIYGVNTGYGGSADVRTTKTKLLQTGFVQLLNVGILTPTDKGLKSHSDNEGMLSHLKSHALPRNVVRAMMLIRCNSLVRGHSGVRLELIQGIVTLLQKDILPVVPLRGSISASGDLTPLSYIAGALMGNPDIYVSSGSQGTILAADKGLQEAGLNPFTLYEKEGLGIANGTATSAAAGSIAMHEAHAMVLLTQVLTAMGTEALLGHVDNYHPFISASRPHHGQREAAANILSFLSGSQLAISHNLETTGLAQDRYALRTAPQWIGPLLENLMLAHQQMHIELNSSTDNPLIECASDNTRIHHGGNFQAASVTSAMEKVASSMQLIGRLMFAQCTELLDNYKNNGLPPNLAADDPSTSFTAKGLDINMAAYMSELGYIANPVSTHVQNAEMQNQSVNSLALIAARVASESIEVLSLMMATYLFALCQALDLRVLEREFEDSARPLHDELLAAHLGPYVSNAADARVTVWEAFLNHWRSLSHLDLQDRGPAAAKETASALLPVLTRVDGSVLSDIHAFQTDLGKKVSELYGSQRDGFFQKQTTSTYLSSTIKVLYQFVRKDLRVPFHRGVEDDPTMGKDDGRQRRATGSLVSEIYVSLRSGALLDSLMPAIGAAGASSVTSPRAKPNNAAAIGLFSKI